MERRIPDASGLVRRRHARGGFTLIELAVVVTIVGVLAVIAVVGYRRYMLRAKVTEAQAVLSAIKIAQEDYRAERGVYLNLGDTPCPAGAGVADKKVGWDPNCNAGNGTWSQLPVHVSGAVQFSFATIAGTGTFSPPAQLNWIKWNNPTAPIWFVAGARCDLVTGDDATELVTSSFQNTIFSRNEGE